MIASATVNDDSIIESTVLVGFTVMPPPLAVPTGFRNIRLSKKWSFVEPYEYPLTKPFLADASAGDSVQKLEVYTDA